MTRPPMVTIPGERVIAQRPTITLNFSASIPTIQDVLSQEEVNKLIAAVDHFNEAVSDHRVGYGITMTIAVDYPGEKPKQIGKIEP